MKAWETIGSGGIPGTNEYIGATIFPTQSFTTRLFNPPARAFLRSLWFQVNEDGYVSIITNRTHDFQRGISIYGGSGGTPKLTHPVMRHSELIAGEDILVRIAGPAPALNLGTFMHVEYEDLPAVQTNYITAEELDRRGVKDFARPLVLANATVNTWEVAPLLSTFIDGSSLAYNSFKTDTEYAILGFGQFTSFAGAMGIMGPCTGQLKIAAPTYSNLDTGVQNLWERISRELGLASIPVMRGLDAANTQLICGASETTGGDFGNMFFVELAPK